MRTRSAIRLAAIASGVTTSALLAASPVFATVKVSGQHYSSLGLTNTILLFVVTPLAIFFVTAGLAVLPSTLTQRRLKKAAPWEHAAIWIGAQVTVPLAIEAAADTSESDAVLAAITVPVDADAAERELVTVTRSPQSSRAGGASAEW